MKTEESKMDKEEYIKSKIEVGTLYLVYQKIQVHYEKAVTATYAFPIKIMPVTFVPH